MEGMMLGLVLGAGAYLLPRLLYQERGDPATSGPAARRQVLTYIPVCLLLAASFLLDTGVSARLGYLLRASVTTGCLVWVMRLYRLPTRRLIHVWMLWAAAWCVPAGFWLTALLPDFRVAAMHLTFAGGFGLMTLIVATRVVVAHCGFESLWDRNSLAVGAVVVLAALATVVRVFVDVYYEAYWELAFVAAALWLAATLIWGILFIPKQAPWHISED